MATFFGAIADDLTGATDLAGLLARAGARVSLRMGIPDSAPEPDSAAFEIIALKCRTAPVVEAVAETRAALHWLREAGAERFYWKYCSTFDSTPDGNIGPVAEALMAALDTDQTIYCPAFPENGRSIYMGNLFVGEVPLAESPMKDHPLTPMRDSNLMRLLAPQVSGRVGLAARPVVAQGPDALKARLAALAADGVAHVIVDAVSQDDLGCIAAACRDKVLITGGSALAMPLAAEWLALADDGGASVPVSPDDGPALVLSGSCSAMTNRQVAAFLAAGHPAWRLDPLELAQNGVAAALDWLDAQELSATPMIYATAEPESVRKAQAILGRDAAGAIVEHALSDIAIHARGLGVRRFVVAGGETSGAVAQGLGIRRLDVGAEIAPGVPWCFARSAGHAVAITLKSGNFGGDSFFSDALERLAP